MTPRHQSAGLLGWEGTTIASISESSPQGLIATDLIESLPDFLSATTRGYELGRSAAAVRSDGTICRAIEALYPELPPVPGFVAREVERFRTGAPFVLIAHQPVFFPYEAVMLNYVLLQEIADLMRPAPCIVHLIMDTDGADERAFHRVKYPVASTRLGFITLSAELGTHWTGWTCNALRAPRRDRLATILDEIASATRREWRTANGRRFEPDLLDQLRSALLGASVRGPSFTTFMISVLAEYAWNHLNIPILFVRYSEILRNSGASVEDLVSKRQEYHALLRSAEDSVASTRRLVPESPDQLFWNHCSRCWTRSAFTRSAHAEHVCSYHSQCEVSGAFVDQPTSLSVVPKVLIEDIFIRTCLKPLAMVNYRGGHAHAAIATAALDALGGLQPPTLTWGSGWLSHGPVEVIHSRGVTTPGGQSALSLIQSGRASMLYAWLHATAEAKRGYLRGILQGVAATDRLHQALEHRRWEIDGRPHQRGGLRGLARWQGRGDSASDNQAAPGRMPAVLGALEQCPVATCRTRGRPCGAPRISRRRHVGGGRLVLEACRGMEPAASYDTRRCAGVLSEHTVVPIQPADLARLRATPAVCVQRYRAASRAWLPGNMRLRLRRGDRWIGVC